MKSPTPEQWCRSDRESVEILPMTTQWTHDASYKSFFPGALLCGFGWQLLVTYHNSVSSKSYTSKLSSRRPSWPPAWCEFPVAGKKSLHRHRGFAANLSSFSICWLQGQGVVNMIRSTGDATCSKYLVCTIITGTDYDKAGDIRDIRVHTGHRQPSRTDLHTVTLTLRM